MTKKTTKKEIVSKEKNQANIDEFIGLASDLKQIVTSLNQRISEVESVVSRIRQRMGL
tara:strand:+ start:1965 stop:2138 length:174 start_codon:yes stop_codon:yes gene_type:complete